MPIKKMSCILLCVLVMRVAAFLGACDRNQTTSGTPSTTVSPDQSLAANEYISLGIPSYDREWTGQDLAVAAAKLEVLAAQSPEKLPRYHSNRSGVVFARIISRDNFKLSQSHSLPFATRFTDSLSSLQSISAITKTYLSAQGAGKVGSDELIELLGASLSSAQVEVGLVDELLPTLSKDDPKYSVRMAGLQQMKNGLAQMVAGTNTTLTETRVYNVAARKRLVGYCRDTFPSIVPKLSAPSQQEVLQRLDQLVADNSLSDLQPGLTSLRDEVRAATKKESSLPAN